MLKRFDEFVVEGRLLKDSFGTRIGMVESKEFAEELFVAMARRCGREPDFSVTKEESKSIGRNDRCNKNGDGMLSADEVKQVFKFSSHFSLFFLLLSTSANKLGS